MNNEYGFRIIRGKGFHITFENGVTVSVQFGNNNYCRNYPHNDDAYDFTKEFEMGKTSENAEVAVWDESGEMILAEYSKEEDSVAGFYTPEKVLKLLNWAKKYKVKERQGDISSSKE